MMKARIPVLNINQLEDLLEDSGYSGFSFDSVEYVGDGNGRYAAVYEVTSEDESGINETVTSTVFITVQPNGDLQADFDYSGDYVA